MVRVSVMVRVTVSSGLVRSGLGLVIGISQEMLGSLSSGVALNYFEGSKLDSVRYQSRYRSVHLDRFRLGEGGNFP